MINEYGQFLSENLTTNPQHEPVTPLSEWALFLQWHHRKVPLGGRAGLELICRDKREKVAHGRPVSRPASRRLARETVVTRIGAT